MKTLTLALGLFLMTITGARADDQYCSQFSGDAAQCVAQYGCRIVTIAKCTNLPSVPQEADFCGSLSDDMKICSFNNNLCAWTVTGQFCVSQ